MKRVLKLPRWLRTLAVALTLVVAATGCTGSQVQTWFRVHRHQEITWEQGHNIAVALNEWQRRQAALADALDYIAATTAIPHEANWDRVAACESGGNWSINSGNGYYGGLQFSLGTWRAYGGQGMPNQNSKRDQILVAERVRTQSSLGHWPVCGSRW